MVRRIRCMLLALLIGGLLICPVFAASTFPDVDENAPYAEAVEYFKVGIMKGDEKGNFNPSKTVTRAEMATIVCRMLRETENLSTSSVFSDVPIDHWANRYIGKAAEFGIVNGYGNGLFGPSDNVTYEQAVKMIIHAVGGESEAQDEGGYPNGYLAIAEYNGLLNGVDLNIGDFMPRSDIAIVIYNCIG